MSVEEKIVPLLPTVTYVLFPYAIPLSLSVVPRVFAVHVIASDEVRIVPLSPTVTNILFPNVPL